MHITDIINYTGRRPHTEAAIWPCIDEISARDDITKLEELTTVKMYQSYLLSKKCCKCYAYIVHL